MRGTPSASDAARSRSAPGSVIARWPLGSSSSAASVIGPGACTLTTRPLAAQAGGLPGLFERVDVLVEQADGAAGDRAGPGGKPVAAGHRVDRHVDQQRTGPADHVGAHAARGQLDEVSQRAREFADDDFGGLARGDAGPRSDAGGGGENTHRTTVFDVAPPAGRQGSVCRGTARVGSTPEGCENVSQMTKSAGLRCCARWWRWLASCARVVDGAAVAGSGAGRRVVQGVDVDTILLDQSRMRAITGAGEHLTIIPSMDGTSPRWTSTRWPITRRAECRFIYAETATFGPDIEAFHKTTFQDPPDGALISEGAAAYRDADAARRAFAALVAPSATARTAPAGN